MAFASFIWLLGIFWAIKPPPPAEDEEENRKALQKQARLGLLRLLLLLLGLGMMLVNFFRDWQAPQDGTHFAYLTGMYGFILLLGQRSEVNRRLATLLVLSPLWLLIIPRYAAYRGWSNESDWAIVAALLLNYVFWLGIGRRFPVGSSQDIVVWGMD